MHHYDFESLRDCRKLSGLTIAELAERAGARYPFRESRVPLRASVGIVGRRAWKDQASGWGSATGASAGATTGT